MNIFNLNKNDINDWIEEYRKNPDIALIDVRGEDEYRNGRIPGSINLPMEKLSSIENIVSDKEKEILVYCLSGGRSSKAEKDLKNLGYKNVKNIGGINEYRGKIER